MPRSVDEGFKNFLAKLTPSTTESQAAKSHRASIEACLVNNFGLKRFVRIGSFGNGTSISGYSDVDYLACLPTDQLTQTSTSSLVKVRNALEVRFPQTGVSISCPAVVVPFGSNKSETTEIVPADFVKVSNGFNIYDIADSLGGWMKASPDAHNDYVRSIDGKLSCKVKPLIRFIKAWKFYRSVPISSFYLELITARYATSESSIIYQFDIRNIFKILYDSDLANIQDPLKISGYITACKSNAAYSEARSKIQTAFIRANNALEEYRKNNLYEAFAWWDLLYNGQFPNYYY